MRGLPNFLLLIIFIISTVSCRTTSDLASFSLSNLTIEPRAPATEELFSVSVTVTNTGDIQGIYDANLCIDQLQIVDSNDVTIISTISTISTKTFHKSEVIKEGESAVITFDSLSLQEGLYIVTIGYLIEYIDVGC